MLLRVLLVVLMLLLLLLLHLLGEGHVVGVGRCKEGGVEDAPSDVVVHLLLLLGNVLVLLRMRHVLLLLVMLLLLRLLPGLRILLPRGLWIDGLPWLLVVLGLPARHGNGQSRGDMAGGRCAARRSGEDGVGVDPGGEVGD